MIQGSIAAFCITPEKSVLAQQAYSYNFLETVPKIQYALHLEVIIKWKPLGMCPDVYHKAQDASYICIILAWLSVVIFIVHALNKVLIQI